jgi:hypothetical protein
MDVLRPAREKYFEVERERLRNQSVVEGGLINAIVFPDTVSTAGRAGSYARGGLHQPDELGAFLGLAVGTR